MHAPSDFHYDFFALKSLLDHRCHLFNRDHYTQNHKRNGHKHNTIHNLCDGIYQIRGCGTQVLTLRLTMKIFVSFGGKLVVRDCLNDMDDVDFQDKEEIMAQYKNNFSICCDDFILINLGVSVL